MNVRFNLSYDPKTTLKSLFVCEKAKILANICDEAGPLSTFGNLFDCRYVSDCRSSGHKIPAWSYTFVEIDHEIISTTILLPSTDSRRVVVSYK